ncbi:MAG: hybrid sensor histidine kinase/response regulator, partial [Acidobacteria bacterium]|nr:hybrid sensor histidine kinase/response regulator [Acidobacteriota bacterium]
MCCGPAPNRWYGIFTRQLLVFSRKQVLRPEVLNLNDSILNLKNLLRPIIGEDIDLLTVLDPALGRIEADAGQMEQIIMNLAVNARDAMLQGGGLTIKTENVTLAGDAVGAGSNVPPGDYVLLTVSDTGHGMDAQTKSQIFDPFFTTKREGKGTGLGLSTVYG